MKSWKRIGLIIAVLSAISLAACNRVQGYTDPARPITVKVNQEFTLALAGNSTTGYTWQESHDTTMLLLVSQDYKPNKEPPGFVGGGGMALFIYQALKKGQTEVTLVYRRSWEPPSTNDETEIFTINIG